jgi:amino acid transporter
MVQLARSERLKKELGLFDVYVVSTGATLSSGFFLLPGLAAAEAGTAVPLGYVLAGLLILPGLMCAIELTTAMPRAGGLYYFLDRSMGPMLGTVGGFGTWIALVLKSAFALIGVGAYLRIFFPTLQLEPVAVGAAVLFGVISLFGAKKSTSLVAMLVVGLLVLLAGFFLFGFRSVDPTNLEGLFEPGSKELSYTAGLVIVSYMGLTKIASVAEEVKDPERNLPLGTLLSFLTVVVAFAVGTSIMIGVVGVSGLADEQRILTPVATVAESLVGRWGMIVMTVGALLAFWSVANAGILSASRYPLAMARDHILPRAFRLISKRRTPTVSTYATVGLVVVIILLLDPLKIAKLAGAFMLLMFALASLAVVVMRESHIESYRGLDLAHHPTWSHVHALHNRSDSVWRSLVCLLCPPSGQSWGSHLPCIRTARAKTVRRA